MKSRSLYATGSKSSQWFLASLVLCDWTHNEINAETGVDKTFELFQINCMKQSLPHYLLTVTNSINTYSMQNIQEQYLTFEKIMLKRTVKFIAGLNQKYLQKISDDTNTPKTNTKLE